MIQVDAESCMKMCGSRRLIYVVINTKITLKINLSLFRRTKFSMSVTDDVSVSLRCIYMRTHVEMLIFHFSRVDYSPSAPPPRFSHFIYLFRVYVIVYR